MKTFEALCDGTQVVLIRHHGDALAALSVPEAIALYRDLHAAIGVAGRAFCCGTCITPVACQAASVCVNKRLGHAVDAQDSGPSPMYSDVPVPAPVSGMTLDTKALADDITHRVFGRPYDPDRNRN